MIAGLYRRDDGMWEVSDPTKELDVMGDLAAAVLLAYAAVEGLANQAIAEPGEVSISGGALWERLMRLRRLHDALVRPRPVPEDPGIFGHLMRGDADTCAEDAIAVASAVRPELTPPLLL
jgi:hypothetical protein